MNTETGQTHIIRPAEKTDWDALGAMRHSLWPDESLEKRKNELDEYFRGQWSEIFPYQIIVCEYLEGTLVGFAEVTLRSRADGCDPSQPVGYLEGWFVEAAHRRHGVGRRLLEAAEAWARSHGCKEMASDTWTDNDASLKAHEALGFEVVDRCINFRKSLV